MRRVYVRETEYRVTDSMYELPERGERPDPIYLYQPVPPVAEESLGFFGWIGIVMIALTILTVASCISGAAKAQSNVRQFYGWSDYGGSKGATVNIYQQPAPPQPVPTPWSGQMNCTPSADGQTVDCRVQACGVGPDYRWHCQ
jgi:hypothetical protein